MSAIFIILLFYIAFLLVVTMMHRNQKEYILSRDSHWLLISLSISAGVVGGNTFVSFTEFVHKFGISAMWVFVGIASGILLINLLKHNLAGLQDKSNVSISDYIRSHYGNNLAIVVSAVNVLRFVAVLVIQLVASGLVLSTLTGFSYVSCVSLIALVVMIYVYFRGFQGVVYSDLFQFAGIVIPLLLVVGLLQDFIPFSGTDVLYLESRSANVLESLLFFLFGIAVVSSSAEIWQRFICLKDSKQMQYTAFATIAFIMLASLLVTIIGLASIAMVNEQSDNAITVFITADVIPEWARVLVMIALVSAVTSTMDTFLMACATSIARDFSFASEEVLVARTKKIIPAVGLSVLFIAVSFPDIMQLATVLINIVFTITPFLLMHMFGFRLKDVAVITGVIFGAIFVLISLALGSNQIINAYGTLLISMGAMLITQFFYRKRLIINR